MLRSYILSCRLCGVRKSSRLFRKVFERFPESWETSGRCYSEKFRDPKNFKWATGRPDDPPKKSRTKMTQRPESVCELRDKQKPEPPTRKQSDLKNPEKWSGRPEETCNRKQPTTGKDKPKDVEKPKKDPKSKVDLSGSKEVKTTNPSGISTVQTNAAKNPPLPVTSVVLEEVRSLNQKPPPCLEPAKITPETPRGAASVFATQFNVSHQGLPELVSGGGRRMEFTEELSSRTLPKHSKTPVSKSDSSTTQLNPKEPAPKPEDNKFYAIPEEKTGSGLKNHLLKTEKRSQDTADVAIKKRLDITVPKLPPLKIVRETFNEGNRHRIYSFGLAETGALGFHKPNQGKRWRKCMSRPLRHQFAEENRVISAEAGYGFTLFYVKSDSTIKLYGCGLNTDFQLGPTDDEVVTYPSPIDLRISSPKTKIVSLSAGRAHSVVATDKEGVFLFGSNSYGQCGRAIEEEDGSNGCTITQIKAFGGEKVVTVTCGQDHSCFVTESGKVFACGWGSEGQTGQGHCMHVAEPCLVTGGIGSEKIVKVAGRCDTVLALSDTGKLFGWGSNEFKQLVDDPDIAQIETPVALEGVHRKCGKIIDVAAGSSFCLVLNQEGDVYVWGYGILGAGPELVKTSVPTLLPRTLFGANDYHPLTVPSKVFCGVDHMAVVNNLKHVYAWGKNKHGCLGIGSSRDQYFPYKLAISADALHVSGAVDHSVVLTNHE